MSADELVLVEATAKSVLGEYDHSISIQGDDAYTIIYGPNGVGKTKFLEIIDALSHLRGFVLANLPFKSATLKYSDGSILNAELSIQDTVEGDNPPMDHAARMDGFHFPLVAFELTRPSGESYRWTHEEDDFMRYIRQSSRYEQVSDFLWQDNMDGAVTRIEEIRERLEGRVGTRSRARRSKSETAPEEAVMFVEHVPSFLIETQRLRIEQILEKSARYNSSSKQAGRKSESRITDQARKIRSLLNDAQTEHSRITQQLDRTFPNRVLEAARGSGDLNPDDIRARYNQQNEFRSRLGRVASVSLDDALSLPAENLDVWALTLLNQYLEDADKKLAPFVVLLKKIELLEQIINDRLLNKTLRVTDVAGLSVAHARTQRSIELESLSSGEQHEIILMIDLLFNVPRGAVVLIDEPEISLHVAWQIAFIPDVERIAELAGFRFVVATHSPQIINDQWARANRLGPVEATF